MYGGNSVTKWAIEYWIHFEGDKVILIERVKTEYDESSTYDREYETMWEVTE